MKRPGTPPTPPEPHQLEHQIGPAKFEVEQIWKMSHKLELKKCFLKQIEMEKVIYRDLPIKQ